MLKITLTIFITSVIGLTSFGQKLLWTSYFGGDNSNGAIIEYDLIADQISTKFSLEGTPLIGSDVSINIDSWDHPGALMKAQDGFYYGVSSLASIATTNLTFINSDNSNNSNGILYRIDPNTYDVKVLHVFDGRNEYISGNPELVATDAYENELSTPIFAPVEVSPGVFYGLCDKGGSNGIGGIYKYDVANGQYSRIASFDKAVHGQHVYSPLVKGDGDNFYGVLKNKNGYKNGYLYRFNETTQQLDFVKDLNDATTGVLWVINNARGSLVYNASINSLVGVKDRFDPNSNWGGGCYAYNISTDQVENRFTIHYSDLSVLGSMPQGICRGQNGKFYIVTLDKGAHNNGTIIEYDYQSNVPLKVHDFESYSTTNAYISGEGLQVIGSKIYGFYAMNGSNGSGAMWSYDYVSGSFNSFLNSDENGFGKGIQTSFIHDNGKLIGQTVFGSEGDVGSIFEYDPNTDAVTVKKQNQSPGGRNLVGEVYIRNNQLMAIANKGGDSPNTYTEIGGYLTLDLTTDQSSFIQGKSNTLQRNIEQNFQLSGVDTTNQMMYTVVDIHYQLFSRKKRMEAMDLTTGHFTTIRNLNPNAFLTNPICIQDKVYYASEDSVFVFNPTTGQQEASSFIGPASVYGWSRGALTLGSNGILYGHTSNLNDEQAKTAIFSYDVSNGATAILSAFDATCRSLNTSLTEHNNKLYGMSNYGGTNSNGYIFSMDMTTNVVDTVYHFDGATDGRIFEGSFTEYNDLLYAVSFSGGQYGNGTLVSFDPSNGTLTTLKHLTIENGKAFKSSPTFWDDSYLSIVENEKGDVNFTLSPNPTNNTFVIEYDDYETISLHNLSGKMVKSFKKSSNYEVQGLESGIYIVRLYKNNAYIGNEKLVISK